MLPLTAKVEELKVSTLMHWRVLHKTCYSMFRRSWTTDLTCDISQLVRILNICKIFHHGIHIPSKVLNSNLKNIFTLLTF